MCCRSRRWRRSSPLHADDRRTESTARGVHPDGRARVAAAARGTAIRRGACCADRTSIAERAERTLAAVERNVRHLVELTHKLEAVARMQSNADSPVVQEVSATTVVQEAARQLREMADDAWCPNSDRRRFADPDGRCRPLELIFVNLLSNAIKYSDPGEAGAGGRGHRITGLPGHLSSRCSRQRTRDSRARADDDLSTLHTRPHRPRGLQHVAGIGLGLSIVDDCVRALGGQIDVRSAEGEGTVFRVTLPTTPATNP